jgi:hypothetical protein
MLQKAGLIQETKLHSIMNGMGRHAGPGWRFIRTNSPRGPRRVIEIAALI